MADDTTERGAQDRARIDVNQDYELRYWAKELGVEPDQLRKAVAVVGPMADRVREYFSQK